MAKSTKPEVVELSEEELEALFSRLEQSNLSEQDQKIFRGTVQLNIWLRQKYEAGKLGLYKLASLLFGPKSEKRKRKAPGVDGAAEQEGASSQENTAQPSNSASSDKLPPKGHGRLGADAYTNAEDVYVTHPTLKSGDPCPEACGGRLYESKPGLVVRVSGQNFANVVRYHIAKLRCSLCGLVINAELPPGVHHEKYDPRFKAILVVQKYFAGVPWYRQEQFQKLLAFPLPDATQWDLTEQLANCVYPVIGALEDVAARGEVIHNDDTPVRIIRVMAENKKNPTLKRTGMFTTGIYARAGSHRVALFYSGTKHAGENLAAILKKRPSDLPSIIHMCDALAANCPQEFKRLLGICMTHGRRKFIELDAFFPEECAFVIEQFAKVYTNDAEAKKKELSAEDRLIYHQTHSDPVMRHLEQWLHRQLDDGLVEPNGGLGKAIQYLLNHWQGLTLFLRVAGAPLDNNVVERALKVAIRLRKNSLNHLTRHGANVAGILMSLIHTCRLSKINAVDYLTVLQENKSAVFKNPSQWLPWNYKETLKEQLSLAA